MLKKGIFKFSEVFFQQKLPMGKQKPVVTTPQEKFRPKARNLWLSLSHCWKNSKFSQIFVSIKCSCGLVKMKYWLPGQVFRDQGWIFFLSSVRKSWEELYSFRNKNFKKVLWTSRMKFRHNRGRQTCQKAVFCPMSQIELKTGFVQKILFSHKHVPLGTLNAVLTTRLISSRKRQNFCSLSTSAKTERSRNDIFREKEVFNKMF